MGTRTFEIYFNDLSPKAQKEFLEFLDIEDAGEGNLDLDIVPLTIYEIEDEDFDDKEEDEEEEEN